MNFRIIARRVVPLLAVALISPTNTRGAEPPLSVDRIFHSDEFQEERLPAIVWSRREAAYYTLEASQADAKGRDLVRVDLASGSKKVVVPSRAFVPGGAEQPLAVESFEFSSDESKLLLYTNSRRVWRRNTRGDYWVLDIATSELRQLGATAPPSSLMFAKFSPDGQHVAYVRENNLYVQPLSEDMPITALTTDGSETLINGTSDWVNEEELDIRDGYRWSPDSRSIAFWQFDTSGVGVFYLLDNTSGIYPRPISFAYPKVGERNSATRIGVVDIEGSNIRWLDIPGDPREHYLPQMEWTPDGTRIALQQLNRLQNTNRVMLADPNAGTTRILFTETDEAWLENDNPFRWVNGGKSLLWLSERDGWRHAYDVNTNDGQLTQVTKGEFDVIDVASIDDQRGWVYFARDGEFGMGVEQCLFRVPLAGGQAERLTPVEQDGWHTYDVSPLGEWAIHTFSKLLTPPTVELIRLPEHTVVRTLVENRKLRAKLAEQRMPEAFFGGLNIGDDVPFLMHWFLRPPDLDPTRKYPLLIYVYGEPYGQTVRDAWTGQRGLWHAMLAQEGIFVASVDNRGTRAPRGRAWRKSVFRQIGILAPRDQAAATRILLDVHPYMDPHRVGIWGWSGGGSMSLNAIFRYPDLYQTAIAVAPNANQLLYDTIYQERYMGLPSDNAENYRLGSPLTHASNLQGNLLLVHGTGDDNGHYQGTEMLINELVAHNKSFTVMPYPGRSHSISEGRNTTRHFYTLLTNYLHQHLLDTSDKAQVVAQDTESLPNKAAWRARSIHGWTVHLSHRFSEQESPALDRALELLETQLAEVVRVVPAEAVTRLREVPLWFSPEYPGTGPKAEYHPGAGWLRDNGRDPAMEKGIEFTNVRIFEAETRRMPNFALHELAHAYHDRVLGNDHAGIKAAYDRALAGGKYDQVERQDSEGRKRLDRAYALTNPQEYFAETTEAFFSRNDFFPFDRAELEAHDPKMCQLLKQVWGVNIPEEEKK